MIYYIVSNGGIFVYDSSKENLFESIYVITNNRRLKRTLRTMLRTHFFIDNNKTQRNLPEDMEMFFKEHIPRVLKLKCEVKTLATDETVFTDDSVLYEGVCGNVTSDNDKLDGYAFNEMKKVVYFQDIRGNRFYYDTAEADLKLAVWVDGPEGLKEMVGVMLQAPKFMGRDRKLHITDDERELFFFEYIPRVFGSRPSKSGTFEIIEI